MAGAGGGARTAAANDSKRAAYQRAASGRSCDERRARCSSAAITLQMLHARQALGRDGCFCGLCSARKRPASWTNKARSRQRVRDAVSPAACGPICVHCTLQLGLAANGSHARPVIWTQNAPERDWAAILDLVAGPPCNHTPRLLLREPRCHGKIGVVMCVAGCWVLGAQIPDDEGAGSQASCHGQLHRSAWGTAAAREKLQSMRGIEPNTCLRKHSLSCQTPGPNLSCRARQLNQHLNHPNQLNQPVPAAEPALPVPQDPFAAAKMTSSPQYNHSANPAPTRHRP